MFRPNQSASCGIKQLGVDADTVLGTLHAPFQKVASIESIRDTSQVQVGEVVILGYGRSTNNLQVRDLDQAPENFVLHSVGEIGIRLVLAQVLEWENGD